MKIFILIISHLLAVVLGWRCNDIVFHYIAEKIDFEEIAKRLEKLNDER